MNIPRNVWYCVLLQKQLPKIGKPVFIKRLGTTLAISNQKRGLLVEDLEAREDRKLHYCIDHKFLWVWWGEKKATYPQTPWFSEWPDQKYFFGQSFYWQAHFTRVSENMLDLHHGPYAHSWVPGGPGKELKRYKVNFAPPKIRSSGVFETKNSQKLGQFFELSNYFPGLFLARPGNPRIWGMMINTPVDEASTWVVYGHFVKVPLMGRFLSYLLIKIEMLVLQLDDKKMVENCTPKIGKLTNQVLTPADQAIVHWYRLLNKHTPK